MSSAANAGRALCAFVVLVALGWHTAGAQNLNVKGTTIGEGNANFLSNLAVGTSATPNVRLSVNGRGTNVYSTDLWVENNAHIQGNESLIQGGRARLRLGSYAGYAGLYADPSSTNVANDLVLAASSKVVRVGAESSGQSLHVDGEVTQHIRDIPTGLPNNHTLAFTGFSGNKPYLEFRIDSSYLGISVFWSSKRFKKNVRDLRLEGRSVFDLRPVEFDWDESAVPASGHSLGLIAEEVNSVFPELVLMRDDQPFSVNYPLLSVILLAELSRQRQEAQATAVELKAQRAEIDELRAAIRALQAR